MSADDVLTEGAPALGSVPVHVSGGTQAASRNDRVIGLIQRLAPFVVLVLTVLVGAVAFGDRFVSAENLLVILESSSFLMLVALGMTLVIISAGIDLSVGSMYAVGAVLTAWASSNFGMVAGVGVVLVPLAVCALLGLLNGTLIGKVRMAPFIVTLTTLLLARGLAFFVSDEGNVTHLVERDSWVLTLGRGEVLGVPMPVVFAVLAVIAIGILLNRTRSGQALFAIGGSEDAAALMGLPVVRLKVGLYVVSATLAGFAGLLTAARSLAGSADLGRGLELQAIAAVVIGGTLLTGGVGTVSGTVAGVLLLGVIQNLINQVGVLSESWQDVVSGTFLIVVVVLQMLLSRQRKFD